MRRAGRPTPGLWMTRKLAQSRQFVAMIARGRKRRLRLLLPGIVAAFVLFCAANARLFIWPTSGMPAHVDAIVMLAGPGDRLKTALRLASERRAPFLVVSRGFNGYGGPCPAPVPR